MPIKIRFQNRCVSVGTVAVAVAASVQIAPVHAQGGEARTIEEVKVTARRSEESVQSVPITVTALDSDALTKSSIYDAKDLMFTVPGFYAQGAGSKENAAYSIRGQGRSVGGVGEPGVVVYFAEVPLPVFGSSIPQYDMQNIQVLKGPQGTLFGRNTTGGAVLFYPSAPTYETSGYLKGGLGNYNYRDAEGAFNTPLIADKLALRVAGRVTRRDGYTENISGKDLDDIHADAFRVSLLFDPTEWIKDTLIYDSHRTEEAGQGMVIEEVTPYAAAFGIGALMDLRYAQQQARGPRKVDYGDFVPRSELHQWGVFNRLEVELGNDIELINISGYRKQQWLYDANTDALPDSIGLLDALNIYTSKQYSTELQLRGDAFDDKVDWLFGGFYLKSKPDEFNGNSFPQFFGLIPGRFGYVYNEQESKAVFANLKFDLGNWVNGLAFNAGYRYTQDQSDACTGRGFTSDPVVKPDDCSADSPLLQPGTAADLNTDSSASTWTVGFDWQMTDELFSYITARRGYRGGGLNLPALGPTIANLQSFEPEFVTDVEIGLRSDWNIGGWQTRFNVSAYQLQAEDTQFNMTGLTTQAGCVPNDPVFGLPPYSPDGDCNPNNDPTNTTLLVNVGDSTINGVDIDMTVAPTDALKFGVTVSLMDHNTDKFSTPANVNFYAGGSNELPFDFSPTKSATAMLRYEKPLVQDLGVLAFSADYYWTGEVDMLAYRADSYGITNLRLDWNDVMNMPLDIGLFARNVFDKEAVVAGALNPPGAPIITVLYNEPRLFGMEVRYTFN